MEYRIYTINISVPSLLNPALTASWEKGLKMVNDKEIAPDEFMIKLDNYTRNSTTKVFKNNNMGFLVGKLKVVKEVYSKQ